MSLMYKKVDHFRYWLSKFTGMERPRVPDHDLERIAMVYTSRPATELGVRMTVKQLGMKYFDDSYAIACYLNGETMMVLTDEEMITAVEMFDDVTGDRINYNDLARNIVKHLKQERIKVAPSAIISPNG